jgi:hypothetical protein
MRLGSAPNLSPFAEEVIDFCAAFATMLRRRSRGRPDAQALAYWMRDAELRRLAEDYSALADHRTVLVPRGTVFHLPPVNVDTIFVYSWALSLLVGNHNIIRLPRRAGAQATAIIDILRELLEQGGHPTVAATNAVLTYDPDKAVTDKLSATCDVRVIWGGDATVREIRRSPLPPRSTELTFPDRFSLAALDARGYLSQPDQVRDTLVQSFYNDAYQFDQLGCSSPRLVVWVGDTASAEEASGDFFGRLGRTTSRHGYRLDVAGSIGKVAFTYRSLIDLPVAEARAYGDQVTVLRLASSGQLRGEFCGGGVFFERRLDTLLDLANEIEPRDQTLSHFGFGRDELVTLARTLNGRGIDRMVPIGEALTFNRIWDGHDLLQAFSRRSTIDMARVHLT